MSHQIIGLTGPAGSGKDAVRAILEELGFVGFAFADPIRNMIRCLLTDNGLSDGWMDNRDLKERIIPALGVSYRHMAQSLGTEWARNLRRDFWLRIAAAFVVDQMDAGETHFVMAMCALQMKPSGCAARAGRFGACIVKVWPACGLM